MTAVDQTDASTTTRTTSTSTPIRTRCSGGCARRRRSTTTSSTTSTRVSRYDDVERGTRRPRRRTSRRAAAILEMIKAGIEMPPGSLHLRGPAGAHRPPRPAVAACSRRRRCTRSRPRSASSAPRCLDPLVGAGGFDFIADLGAQMPMRVIGMLLGIPESRPGGGPRARRREPPHRSRASRCEFTARRSLERRDVRRLHRLARRAPVRRPHDRAAATPSSRTRRRDRARSTRDEVLTYITRDRRRGQRDHRRA